ncbi:MAG: hypothetical protein GY821_10350 [Gammaproteobacteria bacterium]|nr:hypothetical protein [Gammaproteobacteria bacterium]
MKKDILRKLKIDDIVARAERNLGTFSTHHMDKITRELFNDYANINAIDHYVYPEISDIENFCAKFIIDLFNGGNLENYQYISTSGSSEAIFLSILILKKKWQNNSTEKKCTARANFIVSSNSHSIWRYIAACLDIELRVVAAKDLNLSMDVAAMIEKIDSNTIAICATLGITTTLLFHGRATSVLILAIRGQNRLANARLCLPQPSSSPHQLRHA